jgi:hypothetical protein
MMSMTHRKIITGLRAMFAALALMSGSLAPALSLALPEHDACGMACCLESGVCHCHSASGSHSRGESREHPGGEESRNELGDSRPAGMAAATIASSCPAKCAQLPAGFQKKLSIVKSRIAKCALFINTAQLLYARAPRFMSDALLDGSSAPRAPPLPLF